MKSLILLSLFSSLTYASLSLSVGSFVPYFKKMQTSASGGTQFFTLNPYLGIGTQFSLSEGHYFLPEVGYVYFTDTSDEVSKDIIQLHYNFGYFLSSSFLLRYGLTNNWYRVRGKGGRARLRNGSGYTRFKLPKEERISYFTSVDLGFEHFYDSGAHSVRFDANIMSIKNEQERALNYLITWNTLI